MMARAASCPPAWRAASSAAAAIFSCSAGTPVSNGATSSSWPMTPVEATSTSRGLHPISFATSLQDCSALSRPSSPVAALALPELMTTARTLAQRPSPRCSRETVTGAAQNLLVVKTPAALTGSSNSTSARSRRWGFLRNPAWMPPAYTPAALATPPSGSTVSLGLFSFIRSPCREAARRTACINSRGPAVPSPGALPDATAWPTPRIL